MARKILITGASGRLGQALTRALSRAHQVVQFSLDPPAGEDLARLGGVVTGSVTDAAAVAEAMAGADVVIHAAAYPGAMGSPHDLMETNVMGTFTVLEEAGRRKEVQQVIFVSSLWWHGLHERQGGTQLPAALPVREDHASVASGYYDTSKVLGELCCQAFSRRFKKPAVAMRPAWMITEDAERTFRAMPPVQGPHLNDYVGARDLVDAVERLLRYEPADGFEPMLFHAPDQRSTMPSLELVQTRFPGIPIDEGALDRCDGFGALVDCTHAHEKLGWEPRFRCLRD